MQRHAAAADLLQMQVFASCLRHYLHKPCSLDLALHALHPAFNCLQLAIKNIDTGMHTAADELLQMQVLARCEQPQAVPAQPLQPGPDALCSSSGPLQPAAGGQH